MRITEGLYWMKCKKGTLLQESPNEGSGQLQSAKDPAPRLPAIAPRWDWQHRSKLQCYGFLMEKPNWDEGVLGWGGGYLPLPWRYRVLILTPMPRT